MSDRDYQQAVVYRCPACGADVTGQVVRKAHRWQGRRPKRWSGSVVGICSAGHYAEYQVRIAEANEEPPQDQLVIDAFPEWDGSGPVPYNVIPY